jgi:hypothetical protein
MLGRQQKVNNEEGEQNQKTRKKEEEERREINARIKRYHSSKHIEYSKEQPAEKDAG